jgi:hypothetical protein
MTEEELLSFGEQTQQRIDSVKLRVRTELKLPEWCQRQYANNLSLDIEVSGEDVRNLWCRLFHCVIVRRWLSATPFLASRHKSTAWSDSRQNSWSPNSRR